MPWQYTPYILPLLLAAVSSIALAYYIWRCRAAPGAVALVLLMLAVAQWSLCYALELGFVELPAKIFWAKVQYLGIVIIPLTWLAFAFQYTHRDQRLTSHTRNIVLLAIVPLITLALVWTNEAHGLIWSHSPELEASSPFMQKITYGLWFWVHSIFSYLLLMLGTVWLILMLFRSPHLYRQQAGALLLGALVPWVGNGLYLSGLGPVPNLDLTPFAFVISGLILAWGLFRFRLLDIAPVARRAVVDGMSTGLITLDIQNRIIDINPAAQQIIGPVAADAIGRPIEQILGDHTELFERYRYTTKTQIEITLGDEESLRYYDIHISPLTDQQGQLIGRVIVMYDITTRKQVEQALLYQKQLFESLVAVARATTELPSLEATLQNTLDVATRLTGVDVGALFLLDENGVVTHNIVAHGKETLAHKSDYINQIIDRGLAGWVIRHHQAALISDTAHDNRWLPSPNESPHPVRSALAVPIMSGPAMLGVLTLTHPVQHHFNPEDLNLMQAAADQMALAIRNAQIFDAQRRLADRQITLYEVLRLVAGQTDPDQVVHAAAETVTQFVGWSNVIIALPDEDERHLIARAASGKLHPMAGQTFSMAQTIIGLAFKTGQTQLVPDVNADSDYGSLDHPTTCSVLAIPLRRGQRILGVFSLESNRPAAFDTDDVLLAESLAEAVALILDNARLHAETQRQLEEQTALREVSTIISSTLDLTIVLKRLAEQLGQVVDATSVHICSYQPETMTASVLAEYFGPQASPQEQSPSLNTTYNLTQDFPNLITFLRSGQPGLNQVDNPYLAERQRTHMQQLGAQTTLTIPLQIRGETTAYAELRESRRRREFTSKEITLCQGIAQQAAIAIENARLYEETHQHAAGLSALYTVTRLVSQSLVLEDVLPQALSSPMILFGFEAGLISLADPTTGQLRVVAERGMPSALSHYFQRHDLKHSLSQYIYTHQEVLAINDLRQDAPVDVSELVALGFRGYIGIPLLHRQQPLGSMGLFTRQPRPPSTSDLTLLTTIGNQVAVAVTNARLFQTIADQHGRLQALIESNRDGVLLISMDRRVLVTNAPVLNLLGLPGEAEDWTNRPFRDLLTVAQPNAPAIVEIALAEIHRVQQGDEPSGEGELVAFSRTINWLNLPVLADTTPLGRLIVLRDVTEERLVEKMREDLTRTMVHDLRTPLVGISGSLQLIDMTGDNLLPNQRQMLEIAYDSTDKMLSLTNDILDVSRLESGRMPLERDLISLVDLIAEFLQSQLFLTTEKELRLESDVPPTLPSTYLDARLIERVLQNLVGNAIKFTPAGGLVKVTARLIDEEIAGQENRHFSCLHISVSDNGPGISSELQSRLFQKFVTGRQEESGSGLGLAFCKLAIEAHEGQIWVESEPEQGATFNFTLPLVDK